MAARGWALLTGDKAGAAAACWGAADGGVAGDAAAGASIAAAKADRPSAMALAELAVSAAESADGALGCFFTDGGIAALTE